MKIERHASRPGRRRFLPFRRRRRRAQAVIEFALVTGVMLAALLAGLFWWGPEGKAVVSALATRLAGPTATATDFPGLQRSASATQQTPETASAAPITRNARALLGGMCVLIALATAIAWTRWRRRTPRVAETRPSVELCRDSKPALEPRYVAKRQQMLRLLSKDGDLLLQEQLQVRHMMTAHVITVSPEMPRDKVRARMTQAQVRHMLVCGPDQQPIGILSDRDFGTRGGKTAGDLATKGLQTVTPDMPLGAAITHMVNHGISALPVTEGDRLCGILTTTDLILTLQCLLQLWMHMARMVQQETWNRTLWQGTGVSDAACDEHHCQGLLQVVEKLLLQTGDVLGNPAEPSLC